jgi:nucleotide-binding universal stress UspA family protein
MFSHILCATDTSDDADRALHYACEIASENGGELHVVHVVEKLAAGKVAGQNAQIGEHDLKEKVRCQCAKIGDKYDVEVTLHLPYARVGAVARCVADIAKDNDVDLIVVGTRGRSALTGAVLGSVAQGLLHSSSCPVLAIPHRCVKEPGPATDDALTSG